MKHKLLESILKDGMHFTLDGEDYVFHERHDYIDRYAVFPMLESNQVLPPLRVLSHLADSCKIPSGYYFASLRDTEGIPIIFYAAHQHTHREVRGLRVATLLVFERV